MFKRFILGYMLVALFVSPAAWTHSGGHGPVDETTAIGIATNVSEQFVDYDPGLGFGKLSKTWKGIPAGAKSIPVKGNGYYIVRIDNQAEGKALYVLMSVTGDVYDANFSGQFPNLKQ